MQKHINKIMILFPDVFNTIPSNYEFDNLFEVFFDITIWLKENIDNIEINKIHQKLKELDEYCISIPQGDFATNDVYTQYVVSFIEKLIKSEKLRQFLPIIMDKKSFIANKDYYLQWVGKDNYEKTLVFYNKPSLR